MKNKIIASLLIIITVLSNMQIAFFSESNNVGEYKKLLDDIVLFNVNNSDTESIGDWLANGAGGGTDFYMISLRMLGDDTDLSGYVSALEGYIASESVKSAVTKQKNGLALIAAGKRDSDFLQNLADSTIGQLGIMSYIYGLFLLNNGAPSMLYTSEGIAEKIVSMQFDDGGWAISGQYSDVDVTAITVQALAPHTEKNENIRSATERAIAFLSSKQLESGGFLSYGNENPESSAQVIIALTSMGIDPATDDRFIKNGKTAFDGMMLFHLDDGSFCHELGKNTNGMATYQAFMAITALIRFDYGLGPLFLFGKADDVPEEKIVSDVVITDPEQEEESLNNGKNITDEEENVHDITPTEQETVPENSEENGTNGRIWIAVAILLAGAALIVICVIKKQKPATFIAVILITGAAVAAVFLTDIQTPENYYGKTADKENIIGTVSIQIRCDIISQFESEYIPKDGIILPETYFEIEDGDTVYDILVEAVKKYSIHIETTGPKNMVYVNGINHLYEFDYGDLSGWIYRVNGEVVSVGCGQCTLKDGDKITWDYTRELGLDLD
jgi:hypothetical protein